MDIIIVHSQPDAVIAALLLRCYLISRRFNRTLGTFSSQADITSFITTYLAEKAIRTIMLFLPFLFRDIYFSRKSLYAFKSH